MPDDHGHRGLLSQSSLTTEDLAQRSSAVRRVECLREPITELTEAVRSLYDRLDSLEWSLIMTNPEVERQDFNQAYANSRLITDMPKFEEALQRVEDVLDKHGWR